MVVWSDRRLAVVPAVLALSCAVAGTAGGEEQEAGNRVSFQVEAAREVPNDWVHAMMGIQAEDADPAALADRVNQAMRWGLERAKADARVKVRSGGYQTHPVHEQGRLRRWRATQDLILESADAEAVMALIGELQSRLQVRALEFRVSEVQRRRVEEELVEEALAAFRQRAELVRRSLEASRYAIDSISIDTGAGPPPRPLARAGMMAEAVVSPPAIEPGASRVSVRVHGTIALE